MESVVGLAYLDTGARCDGGSGSFDNRDDAYVKDYKGLAYRACPTATLTSGALLLPLGYTNSGWLLNLAPSMWSLDAWIEERKSCVPTTKGCLDGAWDCDMAF